MRIELTPEQINHQASFRDFVCNNIIPIADQIEIKEHIPHNFILKLAREGYFGAALSGEYGGTHLDMISFGLLHEELGKASASVRSLVMLQNMISYTIFRWGTKAQKTHWLPRIVSGEIIAAFALTEPDIGSDAKHIETKITQSADCYIINGQKKWITLGQIADIFLVFGQMDGLSCAILVDKDVPGLKRIPIRGLSGLKASMLAEIHFNDCRILKENLIGNPGFGFGPIAQSALDLGRYCVAWGCVGIAQACLEASLSYVKKRKQFGAYLKEHQLIKQMITDMIVNVEAMRLLCYKAGYLKDQQDPDAIQETLIAKYFASTMTLGIADNAVQIHGAEGCLDHHPVQRCLRDAKIMEIIEGTTQIHQLKIADMATQGDKD